MVRRIVIGADEAGRGVVIGPMVIGTCAIDESVSKLLVESNIRDSKNYSSDKKLQAHSKLIKQHALSWRIKVLSAEVLNNFNQNKMTMDEAEAYAFFQAINEISKKVKGIQEFQVDNFQAAKKLRELLANEEITSRTKLVIIPRAETAYISVSAASILARARFLEEMGKIRNKYGDFGSGSTNDKKTIGWLKAYYEKNRSWPREIVRTYWTTIRRIEKEFI